MKLNITINSTGVESGPFYDLFISSDGTNYIGHEAEVAKSQLVAGYITIVPNNTVKVRVKSVATGGEGCTDYVDVNVTLLPGPTTTTTTVSPFSPLYVGQTYGGGIITEVAPDYSYGIVLRLPSLGGYNHAGAIAACRALVDGGYSDWDLPNIFQLEEMYRVRASLGVTLPAGTTWGLNAYSDQAVSFNFSTGVRTWLYNWNTGINAIAIRKFFRN